MTTYRRHKWAYHITSPSTPLMAAHLAMLASSDAAPPWLPELEAVKPILPPLSTPLLELSGVSSRPNAAMPFNKSINNRFHWWYGNLKITRRPLQSSHLDHLENLSSIFPAPTGIDDNFCYQFYYTETNVRTIRNACKLCYLTCIPVSYV